MYCRRCNYENENNACFCARCGASLQTSDNKKERKRKKNAIVIIILLVELVSAIGFFLFYNIIWSGQSENASSQIHFYEHGYDQKVVEDSVENSKNDKGKEDEKIMGKKADEKETENKHSDKKTVKSSEKERVISEGNNTKSTEIDEESQTVKEENVFTSLPSKFDFSAGVGAWCDSFELCSDGSFEGTYSDQDWGVCEAEYPNGTVYTCTYKGSFSSPEKIDSYRYSMKLNYIDVDNAVGTESYADGVRYLYTSLCGFENASELILYMPGCPLENMAEEFVQWWKPLLGIEGNTFPEGWYGIYNVNNQTGFVGQLKG